MSKSLVIVESNTKTKTIAKFLGKNYELRSSVGHVKDLPKKRLGVNIEENFEPEYVT
ncbi:MAG: toprim domain-containing protein, partial [bacterium]